MGQTMVEHLFSKGNLENKSVRAVEAGFTDVMERSMITKAGPGLALLDDPDVRRAYMSI